ncbi:MAG: M15 family metallopeptidase [Treponema sp.]|nr:M15 family metallopeptidase [Treponema sp.]
MRFYLVSIFFLLLILLLSCSRKEAVKYIPDNSEDIPRISADLSANEPFISILPAIFQAAEIPANLSRAIQEDLSVNPGFILDLLGILRGDPYLRLLVDKRHSLPQNYAPGDLVELRDGSYRISRASLMLRREAAAALDEMAAAARTAGHTLVASSSYRSYNYQSEVYDRNVREMGQQAADMESARPGTSQHQLGLALDFGSIDDSFAQTGESRWLAANASRFGWSLSYPSGYEEVTGYRWESWHYRYVGRDLAVFIENYFGGIQQYALRFIYEWERQTDS